ncbi:MAG: tRNA (adenosine(37)-N6)-threonylcarbamoyltransferase complex dimerization subunit type 1 TsaB [Planctomycetota bacterium]|nr:tRNA (adenosine(37)-N6)-threonylcarbamoyltransferase complex dimerization subunit type 1 TsaB [Planctomycetota bacterium]
MADRIILAIETSQREGSVALRDAAGDDHAEPLLPSRRHDDDLMPAIDRMMKRAGLTPRDLDAVGVSIGPGGFTGVRIAVSTAKMLAMTLDVNVIAVPTALVVAEGCRSAEVKDGPIIVALSSKRDSFWSTTLLRRSEGWTIEGEPGLADAANLSLTETEALLADRYLPEVARRRAAESSIPILEPRFEAGACLRLAARRLAAGEQSDPLTLRPLYPRPPEAVSLLERRRVEGDASSR